VRRAPPRTSKVGCFADLLCVNVFPTYITHLIL
jgi:hypothetical protein